MNNAEDFTLNLDKWASVKELAAYFRESNQKVLVTVNSGISSEDAENKYYKQALETNSLIDSTINMDVESGKVTQR
jgi:alpha-glucosidase (family GH31 glycosyl hydrolase)